MRHFTLLEARKPRYAGDKEELDKTLRLPDSELAGRIEDFSRQPGHDRGNPVYTWVFQRGHLVERWVHAEIHDLDQVFSSDINDKAKYALDSVEGNLVAFGDRVNNDPALTEEFGPYRPPIVEVDQTIIGVVISYSHRMGSIELIDGAHRFVAMARANVKKIPAFLAILKM